MTTTLALLRHRAAVAVAAVWLLSALGACGGGGGDADAPATAATAPTPTAAATAAAAGATATAATTGVAVATAASAAEQPAAATPAARTAVILRASASIAGGTGALVTLRWNGVRIGATEVRSAEPADHRFEAANGDAGGTLEVVFTNAADAQGSPVRHLRIDSLTVGSVTLRASDSVVSFDRGDGVDAFDSQDVLPGRSVLTANGALRVAVPAVPQTQPAAAAAATTAAAPGVYLDSGSGSDNNDGSIARPWRTLARLAGVTLPPGQGVYLRCGAVWREALNLPAAQVADGVTVAGYGDDCASRKAVISGADDFSGGWTRSGDVWSRPLPAGTPRITQLFVDGIALRQAQWPNAGEAIRTAGGAGAETAKLALQTADAAGLAARDLVGAVAQVRTQPWFVETRTVTQAPGSSLVFDTPLQWSLEAGESYVLQGKLWMLDSPGEYVHDVTAQRLYLMPPAVGVPADVNAAQVEGSVRDTALSLRGRKQIVVRDLALRAARGDGLYLVDAASALVKNIEAVDNGSYGIRIEQTQGYGDAGPSVRDSLIAGNGRYGIKANEAWRTTIRGNRILATGNGAHHSANVNAAVSAGPGSEVSDNVVDGAGYLGIEFSAREGSVVARNTVSRYCQRLSDCGAIYTWQGRALAATAQASTVEGNRIFAAQADLAGAVSAGREVVVGVYLDDFTRNAVVRDNTLFGTPIGVFLHNASNTVVSGNQILLPTLAAVAASMDQTDADWLTANVVRDNRIVPLVQAQLRAGAAPSYATSQAFWFWHALDGEAALAPGRNAYSGNVVVQPQGALAGHAWLRGPGGERTIDAIDWQRLAPGDPLPQRPVRYGAVALTLGPELAPGGDFDAGLGSWGGWQDPAGSGGGLQAMAALPGCSGGCARMTAGSVGDLLGSAPFSLRPGALHVYRWTAVMPATQPARVAFPYISRNASPWDVMADSNGFSGYGPRQGAAGEVLPYEVLFSAKSADPARVNVQLETLRTAVGIDAVSVREVTAIAAARAGDWAALAFAPSQAARSVGCAELGWPDGCQVTGLDGDAVALPVTVPAGTQRLLLRADTPYRR